MEPPAWSPPRGGRASGRGARAEEARPAGAEHKPERSLGRKRVFVRRHKLFSGVRPPSRKAVSTPGPRERVLTAEARLLGEGRYYY